MSDVELIARLKPLLAQEGRLTSHLMHEDPDLPSPTTCLARLGGAAQLYALVGYMPAGRQKGLTLGRFRSTDGLYPSAINARASTAAFRALGSETSGYRPSARTFCLPSNR